MRVSLPNTTSNELLHFDSLRFLASAGIVYHHSHEFFFDEASRQAEIATSQGLSLFVDLFFLISGYVIAHMYFMRVQSVNEYLRFMAWRIFRLVPLHWLTLVCSMIIWNIMTLVSPAANGPDVGPACFAATAFLVHSIAECGNVYNGQSWSVSAEMVVYTLFPLLAVMSSRNRIVPFLVTLGGITAVLCLSSTTLQAVHWSNIHAVARAIISFSFGVGLWAFRDRLSVPRSRELLWFTFIALVICMINGAPMFLDLCLIYIIGILAVASDKKECGPVVALTARLGQLTYSIYMWHGMIILVMMNALGDKILHLTGAPAILLGLICYIVIFVVSAISLEKIEKPANRYLRGLYDNRRGLAVD